MKARELIVSEAVGTDFELDQAIETAHELQDRLLKDGRSSDHYRWAEDGFSDSDHESTALESPIGADAEMSDSTGRWNFPPVARDESDSISPIGLQDFPVGPTLPPILPSPRRPSIFPRPPKFYPLSMNPRPVKKVGWQPSRAIFRQHRHRQAQAGTTKKSESISQSKLFKAQHRVVPTDVSINNLKPGSSLMGTEKKVYSLEELKALNFEVVGWEGVQPKPFLSKNGEIFILPAGRPNDKSFVDDLKVVEEILKEASEKVPAPGGKEPPRRGRYPVISTGISYGGGSKRPAEMKVYSKRDKMLLDRLEECKGMKRLVGFINRQMQVFCPDLWLFSKATLNVFEIQNYGVRRHFPGHPLAATTFNLGPVVTTFPHRDMKNLSWGWCAITSFGDYDPKRGGHLVLWDLKVALEFPPYSTVFIPSAIVIHGNTAVAEGETRRSITQYNSAGLFGWSAHGNVPYREAEEVAEWWKKPKHMFSKISDLMKVTRK